jgi:hypothetical protein
MDDPANGYRPATRPYVPELDSCTLSQKQLGQLGRQPWSVTQSPDAPLTVGEYHKVIHGGRSRVLHASDYTAPAPRK